MKRKSNSVSMSRLSVMAAVLASFSLAVAAGPAQAEDGKDPFAPLRGDPRDAAAPGEEPETVKKVIAFDESGQTASKNYRIAYLTECVTNLYCEARLRGLTDAAEKYGFTFKTYDPNFNPQAQLKHVQNAVQEGFDGYLFAPTADAAGCKMWKDYLVPTGKPVVTLDLTMCGDIDYTPGVAATVTIQRQPYYDFHWENAFLAACEGDDVCKVVSLGGFAGSDLFTRWDKAIDNAIAKYPHLNIEMVSRQESKFDPRIGMQLTQDALQAHPDLDVIVSHDDDMSLGALAAIKKAGLKPGVDVLIFNAGANGRGVKKIIEGEFNESTVEDPYNESYYAAVALVMALEGDPPNGYINEAHLPRITRGSGSILITKQNIDNYEPNW